MGAIVIGAFLEGYLNDVGEGFGRYGLCLRNYELLRLLRGRRWKGERIYKEK